MKEKSFVVAELSQFQFKDMVDHILSAFNDIMFYYPEVDDLVYLKLREIHKLVVSYLDFDGDPIETKSN